MSEKSIDEEAITYYNLSKEYKREKYLGEEGDDVNI